MDKPTLLKELEVAIDEAFRQRIYGNIEIVFRAGHPTFLRTMNEKKLDETGTRDGQKTYR